MRAAKKNKPDATQDRRSLRSSATNAQQVANLEKNVNSALITPGLKKGDFAAQNRRRMPDICFLNDFVIMIYLDPRSRSRILPVAAKA